MSAFFIEICLDVLIGAITTVFVVVSCIFLYDFVKTVINGEW